MYDSIPNQHSNPPASPTLIHLRPLWVFVAILVAAILFWSLYRLSKAGLLVILPPGTAVDVHICDSDGSIISEHTGHVVFSLPFLACLWYGNLTWPRVHSLFQTTITRSVDELDLTRSGNNLDIPLSHIDQSGPGPYSIQSLPIRPHRAILRSPITHNLNHRSVVLPGLEFPRVHSAFGPVVSRFSNDSSDEEITLPYPLLPSPKPSYSYLSKGAPFSFDRFWFWFWYIPDLVK